MVIAVNIILVLLILFTIGWFWIYKPKPPKIIETGSVDVIVKDGVYTPDTIRAYVGKPITLNFILKDDTHCARTVSFSDLNISRELSKEKPEKITITPERIGEIPFACPMTMYKGKLIVEEAPAIDIVIDGGTYTPDIISAKAGETVNLRFIRKDPSHCAETVVFSDFKIAEEIPINTPKIITIKPLKPGQYAFTCAMGMYRGKLMVEQ